MKTSFGEMALVCLALAFAPLFAQELTPPKAGKPPILPLSEVKPGMQAIAWTVFSGTEPEPVPVEIIGIWKNAMGPRQDVIMGKMGGKAKRTGVAGGMSGSPVYVDGKLMGAISLRLGAFSPDAICGITPIESMLEIQDFDKSRPADARTPDKASGASSSGRHASDLVSQLVLRAARRFRVADARPIDTPLMFSGFTAETYARVRTAVRQMGITPVQGGASGGQSLPRSPRRAGSTRLIPAKPSAASWFRATCPPPAWAP